MLSQEEARKEAVGQIGIKHIFQALVYLDAGVASQVMTHLGVNSKRVREVITKLTVIPKEQNESTIGVMTFSKEAKEALQLSAVEADKMGHGTIETEHILLGVIGAQSHSMTQIINMLGINLDEIRNLTMKYIADQKKHADEEPQHDTWKQALNQYSYIPAHGRPEDMMRDVYGNSPLNAFTVDLTQKAEEGKLQKVLCRSVEIDRAIRTLCRRHKRNPILIGEPGVGKTAVVEGIAMQLLEGHVMENMRNKRIRQLDIGLMVAGARFRGQFEERLTKLIEEIKSMNDIILVIDEAHMIVGAGAGEGALDAANLLKPSLARGEIQCIAITTPKEYRKHFEKDAALSRRFQPIYVNEPSDKDTREILYATAEACGKYHKVNYNTDAVDMALKYAKQFLPDRYLPDKAIDIIDEAGSLAKIRYHEQVAGLYNESGVESTLDTSTKGTITEKQTLGLFDRIKSDGTSSETVNPPMNTETETKDESTGVYKGYQVDKKLEAELLLSDYSSDDYYTSDDQLSDIGDTTPICEVNTEHVAEVVSAWTGIPLNKLSQGEVDAMKNMENELHKTVIGHEDAVKHISKAIRRAKTKIKNPDRPIGSFLFCGPPGVGKSEIARALTKLLFTKENLIKLDMSEYNEPHSISRILGSPPGYKGHDSGGQLTEKLRKNPYSVVMFDEIEKAHRDVLNVLLQILEDGKLTDSRNQTVSFKNAVIIMTSNIGSSLIEKSSNGVHSFGFNIDTNTDPESSYQKVKHQVCEELKNMFKPELIDRIDDVILFKPLNEDQLKQIAILMMQDTVNRAKENGIQVTVDDSFVEYILKLPRDSKGGARPLRRIITTNLDDTLSDFLISPDYIPGLKYRIAVDENSQVVLKAEAPKEAAGTPTEQVTPPPAIIVHNSGSELLPLLPTPNEVDV
ncbi:ATP-dependent Clp protease ATP-binding [Babesia ovis]|uniref:ATP-dependent Clp protease ATP-binding n=1 Tax=Babesia ovis TaxID=5869 RepID=A0A9W5WU51_BABOV|nr:ATP-dependent Clp protease ATP-binding [Babesia ovis]